MVPSCGILVPSQYHESVTILSWHYHERRRQGSNMKKSWSYPGTAGAWYHHLSVMVLTRRSHGSAAKYFDCHVNYCNSAVHYYSSM